MASFLQWLSAVVTTGESVLESAPEWKDADQRSVLELLRSNFERHALDVAGPPVAFDAETSLWSAQLLAAACWRLVADGEPAPLDVAREPDSAAAHLSADAMLRFLPAVYRRAKSRADDDPLAAELEVLLRRWPLTGVRLDLEGSPTTAPDFAGHPGLQLLYAERFVEFPRHGWLPPPGPGREWVERICEERGRPLPPEPKPEESPRA